MNKIYIIAVFRHVFKIKQKATFVKYLIFALSHKLFIKLINNSLYINMYIIIYLSNTCNI